MKNIEPGTWNQKHETWNNKHETWNMERGTRNKTEHRIIIIIIRKYVELAPGISSKYEKIFLGGRGFVGEG